MAIVAVTTALNVISKLGKSGILEFLEKNILGLKDTFYRYILADLKNKYGVGVPFTTSKYGYQYQGIDLRAESIKNDSYMKQGLQYAINQCQGNKECITKVKKQFAEANKKTLMDAYLADKKRFDANQIKLKKLVNADMKVIKDVASQKNYNLYKTIAKSEYIKELKKFRKYISDYKETKKDLILNGVIEEQKQNIESKLNLNYIIIGAVLWMLKK